MKAQPNLEQLSHEQVRTLAAQLLVDVEQKEQANRHLQAINDKLTHEIAILRRHRYARRSETLNQQQASLLDELIDADIGAIEEELSRAGGSWQKRRKPGSRNPDAHPYHRNCLVPPLGMNRTTPPAAVAVS